jgi:hypothetical protein
MIRVTLAAILVLGSATAADWSAPVEVHHDTTKCVTYRAKLSGDFLVVNATHEPGWHTNAMDNEKRAEIKLAGKQALGVDRPTSFKLSQGLEVAGPWYQTEPKDKSKPELRWFTWIFEGEARFVAKVKHAGAGPGQVAIRGQACTESICKEISVTLAVPLQDPGTADVDLKSLVQVQ